METGAKSIVAVFPHVLHTEKEGETGDVGTEGRGSFLRVAASLRRSILLPRLLKVH
jgi:hypothetical protein